MPFSTFQIPSYLAHKELTGTDDMHGIEDPRTILLMGDRSFQTTAQEIATMIKHNLNVAVFYDSYTIERCIDGLGQGYSGVASWRYLDGPRFFSAPEGTFTASGKTW